MVELKQHCTGCGKYIGNERINSSALCAVCYKERTKRYRHEYHLSHSKKFYCVICNVELVTGLTCDSRRCLYCNNCRVEATRKNEKIFRHRVSKFRRKEKNNILSNVVNLLDDVQKAKDGRCTYCHANNLETNTNCWKCNKELEK